MSWFISDLKRIICDCILICPRNQKPFSTLCCWIFITNIQAKITLFSFIVSFLCLSFHWTSLFNGHFNDSRYLVTVSFPYTEIHFGLYIFIYKSRMDHSFDIHLERVQKLYRVCGERNFRDQTHKSRKGERLLLCDKYAKDILLYFRINIKNDINSTHSKNMCMKCYKRMLNNKTRGVSQLTLDRAAQLMQNSSHIMDPL